MPLGPGSRLDAYELLQPLGAGGMGEVWLATEVRLGRKVALKLLPDELTRDPARVSRFQQEARAASGLSHPNVCTIHALGERRARGGTVRPVVLRLPSVLHLPAARARRDERLHAVRRADDAVCDGEHLDARQRG
jgi:serine/threonine protein kinase